MGETSMPKDLPPYIADSQVEKQLAMTPPFQNVNPICRLSPRHNGSTLYDSFELQAVTRQLNKAMHGSIGFSPTYLSYIKSPFYRKRLDRMLKENAKSPKKIGFQQANCATHDRKGSTRAPRAANRGLVGRLWKKVKQGLLWYKQKN